MTVVKRLALTNCLSSYPTGCLKSVIPSGAKRSREPVPSLSREIPLARERLILAKEIPPLAPPSLGRDDKTAFLDSLGSG